MKNWEEMFDEKYPSLSVWDDEDITDEVKDFIRRLLEEQELVLTAKFAKDMERRSGIFKKY